MLILQVLNLKNKIYGIHAFCDKLSKAQLFEIKKKN
jgi:hypothetical protein